MTKCKECLETINLSLEETVPIIGCSGAAVISNQGIFIQGVVILLLSLSKPTLFFTLPLSMEIKQESVPLAS